MNIGIATVFNSMNDGSFWQSMMLKRELEKRGHRVSFLKVPDNPERPALTATIIGRIAKYLIRDGVTGCYKYILSIKEFAEDQKQFDEIKVEEAGKLDLIILGSDMIWCREGKPYFDKYHEFFWGELFHNVPIATYAGSCGSMHDVADREWLQKAVGRWKKISVRDDNTYRIIKEGTEADINIVCDPTLLVTADEYRSLMKGYVNSERYILLYMFSNLTSEQGKQIISFAEEKKLKIVSLIRRQRNMPRNSAFVAVNSPYRLIEYYAKAEYVITDTFHGSIFAILFGKDFVTINHGKTQVNEVVTSLGYADRIVDKTAPFLPKLVESVDFTVNQHKLDLLRAKSIEYLENCLE
ncbi:MAG: polysaccharide pyruvyl transferase family protein [Butyrivibrio sp.]|nr:polysaccharide pyruvyl transferase family protein [Butyrivibrio sp.]